MASALERLLNLANSKDRHDVALDDVLSTQIEAANERFNTRVGAIKLLGNRAETAGIKSIGSAEDLVPLLFAHTAYKSYPESWLSQGRWDRMASWLDTVSSHRVKGLDTKGVVDIDDWIARLGTIGHYVSCSSGTTGKVSMINAAMPDRTFNKQAVVESYAWSTGITPDKSYKVIRCNPASNGIRNIDTSAALIDAFGNADTTYHFPGGVITVGSVRKMVELRRSIAEGTALPSDVAAFETTSAERQKTMDGAVGQIAQAMIDNRDKKLLMVGMFATLFKVAETLQSMGYSGKDFHPENSLMVGGGLKGAVLPHDYRERILAAFNIKPKRVYHFYSMQELNTHMPRCEEGQYHVPPWLMVLPLDQPGEKLVSAFKGEVEGRAAFFDLSHDGRWCGVITGDKIKVRYGKCACGHEGPTVGPDIVRYSELEGGDKISCAGTIDAYVRGAA